MKTLDLNQMEKLKGGSWGCFWSVAGTIAATASAFAVTGGAALVIFLAGKTIATAAIISSCS